MKKFSVIVLAVLSIAFVAYADAATPKKRTRNSNRIGAYGGAILGYTKYSNDQAVNEQALEDILVNSGADIQGELSSSTEDADIGYQVMFGFRFNRYFAAELGLAQFGSLVSTARGDLDFGDVDNDGVDDGFVPTSVAIDFTAGGPVVSVIGILPLNDKFEVYARLGYLFASAEREFSARINGENAGSGSSKGDSQDPVYGVGFSWHINQVYSIRGEVQKLDGIGDANRSGQEDITVMGLGVIVRF